MQIRRSVILAKVVIVNAVFEDASGGIGSERAIDIVVGVYRDDL